MNSVSLVGNVATEVEARYSGEMCITKYTLAVQRRFAKDGEQTADFIRVIAFGKAGEFAEKYFKKGMKVGVNGRIQTSSYTNKDGQKVYVTDVVAENQEFCEKKQNGSAPSKSVDAGFMQIDDTIMEELPFN